MNKQIKTNSKIEKKKQGKKKYKHTPRGIGVDAIL
jgi:hypothetical protein